jgi:hypothetical protein
VVAIIVALVLIALVVTAVICMLRKPAMPMHGATKAGTGSIMMAAAIPRQSLARLPFRDGRFWSDASNCSPGPLAQAV